MSLVPLIFRDWWDDWDRERPSRLLDQHFGNVLNRDDLINASSLIRPTGYFRPWRHQLNRGTSNITAVDDKVQVVLDVQQFAPNEISVRTVDNVVIVEGKHDEKRDEHGYISRHFVRKYLLPKDVIMSEITSALSSDGILTINAPKQLPQDSRTEREIPIIQTGSPAIKPSTETNIKIEQVN
ncbi:unnamed protein product [Nezara viridula]|uniref:SHSP domain-containing protein n=1 Tax=Nezara viridula TaxID=85310 RepID=A0A9P0GZP6_NEZVI|nr:unnamed protein product [Nezara viridula]